LFDVWVRLGHGSISSPGSGLGWIGSVCLWVGLGWVGWVMKMDPLTTLHQPDTVAEGKVIWFLDHHSVTAYIMQLYHEIVLLAVRGIIYRCFYVSRRYIHNDTDRP